ncbi:MAG: hydrogen peroxide-inducible genes activator [Bdellovibrionales bacterium]|nr:hydrogen peroxide-inducible genes activator [Bdellovibrionales bacterium]
MPTITQLEYLVAVSKQKHFGRAAKDCNISQPTLSAQIQKLEEELGIIVFDRSKKPVMTTDKGKKVVAQARTILQEYSRLFDIPGSQEGLRGEFSLGIIPTLAPYVLPLFIESFSEKYPDVKLNISEYKTEDIVRKLYDDELDGGLLVTPLHDDKLIERSLFLEPFYGFVADGHPHQTKSELSDKDLESDDIWLLNEGHCFRDQVLKLCAQNKDHHVLKSVNFESGNLETLKNLIRKGKGYTLLPHLATLGLSDSEKAKNLKPLKGPVPSREVSLVHSRSFLKEDIIAALVDEIASHLPSDLKNLKRGQVKVVEID